MQIISSKVYAPSDTDDRLSIRWLVRSNRERMDSFLVNPWEENLLAYIIDSQKRRTGSGRWRSRSRYESRNESEDIVVWKIHEKDARNIWRFLSSIMHIASIFIVCSKPETYVCSTSFQGELDAFIDLEIYRKGHHFEQNAKFVRSFLESWPSKIFRTIQARKSNNEWKKKKKRCEIINTYRYLKWIIFHQRLGCPHALRIFITIDLRYKNCSSKTFVSILRILASRRKRNINKRSNGGGVGLDWD